MRRRRWRGGNVAVVVRHCAKLFGQANPLEQAALLSLLRDALRAYHSQLWPIERKQVRRLISQLRPPRALAVERRHLLDLLADEEAFDATLPVGQAITLLAGTGWQWGQSFGCCQPLAVMIRPSRGEVRLSYAYKGESLSEGFREGVLAAVESLMQSGLWTQDAALGTYSFDGSFPNLNVGVDGTSLGLAAAVATISALLRVPVARTVAFTGRVDRYTTVGPVGGIREKLEAARDKGIERVFLRAGNDVPGEFRSLVQPVHDLGEVIRAIFPHEVKTVTKRAAAAVTEFDLGPDANTERWLFTCVGTRDPFGEPRRRSPEDIRWEEGPVLAACRTLRPRCVFLFHTVHETHVDGTRVAPNDYRENAREVKRIVEQDDPACQAELIELETVSDPTDYRQLVPAFGEKVAAIRARDGFAHAALYVSLSSGTSQMEHVWHLLMSRPEYLAGAQGVQVREGRFVAPGESRTRRMDVPGL